jgi:hypothetical protein
MVSGSPLVPALSHAVWNGVEYPLFGVGEKMGALGIGQTHIYGPEAGLLGIACRLPLPALIWRRYVAKSA